MAFHGSASPVKKGMTDQTSSNIARDGSAKRTQTKYPVKDGMKNSQSFAAGAPGSEVGPDADPAQTATNPANAKGKNKRTQTEFANSWGMRDANGNKVNSAQGKQVLAEGEMGRRPG